MLIIDKYSKSCDFNNMGSVIFRLNCECYFFHGTYGKPILLVSFDKFDILQNYIYISNRLV